MMLSASAARWIRCVPVMRCSSSIKRSEDETEKVAREHGATFKTAIPGVTSGAYAMDAAHEWILCLRCNEALSDELEATLVGVEREGARRGPGLL